MKLDKARETKINCPEINFSLVWGIVLSMMSFEFYLNFVGDVISISHFFVQINQKSVDFITNFVYNLAVKGENL